MVLWVGSVQVLVVVCVLLLLVLAFAYAQSLPASGSVSAAERYNWSSPLSHIRLLSLPIAKKYNLHSKDCTSSGHLLTTTSTPILRLSSQTCPP